MVILKYKKYNFEKYLYFNPVELLSKLNII